MTGRQVAVVWFKRDLRTVDHPALVRAAASGLALLPQDRREIPLTDLPAGDLASRQCHPKMGAGR